MNKKQHDDGSTRRAPLTESEVLRTLRELSAVKAKRIRGYIEKRLEGKPLSEFATVFGGGMK
jgi:hypothetical protein